MLSNKFTAQINSELKRLRKLILLQNENEIMRTSRQIVKLQIRRDKNDKRVSRLEGYLDTILDAMAVNDIKIDELCLMLDQEISKMEAVKGGVKNYEKSKIRVEVLCEEVQEDELTENVINELAEKLVYKTTVENVDLQ
ncbi:hypothetical protein BDAP_002011 [Binucleata daphniae]